MAYTDLIMSRSKYERLGMDFKCTVHLMSPSVSACLSLYISLSSGKCVVNLGSCWNSGEFMAPQYKGCLCVLTIRFKVCPHTRKSCLIYLFCMMLQRSNANKVSIDLRSNLTLKMTFTMALLLR